MRWKKQTEECSEIPEDKRGKVDGVVKDDDGTRGPVRWLFGYFRT